MIISFENSLLAFYSLKTNKSPGYDNISFNIIKQHFGTWNRPLHYIYNISLQSGVFREEMKIAGVNPIFKGGQVFDLGKIVRFLLYVAFLKFSRKLCIIIFTNIYLMIM